MTIAKIMLVTVASMLPQGAVSSSVSCAWWCQGYNAPWVSKCAWSSGACSPCAECEPHPIAKCEGWCNGHASPWSDKCMWNSLACAKCSPCSPLGYPTWEPPTPPEFTISTSITVSGDIASFPASVVNAMAAGLAQEINVPVEYITATVAAGSVEITFSIKNRDAATAAAVGGVLVGVFQDTTGAAEFLSSFVPNTVLEAVSQPPTFPAMPATTTTTTTEAPVTTTTTTEAPVIDF